MKIEENKNGAVISNDDGTSSYAQFADKNLGDNFQYLQNPETKKTLAVGKDFFSQYGQGLSDIGGYVPVGNDVFSPKIPGISNAPTISEGTESIQDQANALVQGVAGLGGDTNINTDDFDIGAEFENLKEMNANIRKINTDELAQIDEAGKAAGAEYNELIRDAQDSAKYGQAANIVATGRRGGFQRARYAGEAALGPTVGDVGYEGSGGKLEYTRSAYQRNINALKDQQSRAIALAKQSARAAIQSGKEADFTRASSILDFARKLRDDQRQEEQDMFNNMFNLQQESRQQTATEFGIIKDIPEGKTIVVNGQEFTGIAIPESEKAFFSGSNIISLMNALKKGETQEITDPNTGTVFTVSGLSDPDTVTATDDQGNVSVIDKMTGDVISKAIGAGKTKTQAANVTLNMAAAEKGAKQEIVDNLNSARDPQTGKVTPDAYVSQFTTFLLNNLGDVGAFRASFPPSLYLSPAEAKAVNEELATAEAGLSTLTKDQEEEDLF